MSTRRNDADVVVVGGGITGTACALAFARAGFDALLVDAKQAAAPGDAWGLRTVAVSPDSIDLLKRLNVWSRLPDDRIGWFDQMRVWDGRGEITFSAAELGIPMLGAIVEHDRLVHALWQALADSEVTLEVGQPVARVYGDEWQPRLQLTDERRLRASLIVGADGRDSKIRDECDIETRIHDYRERGLVANIESDERHQQTAWQRFLPGGPVALLPLANGQCSVVWTLPNARARELQSAATEDFEAALTDATAGRLGDCRLVSEIASFPLIAMDAEHWVADGIALVGDAGRIVHPLAGQGANLGLADARALVSACERSRQAQLPIGAIASLRPYERRRRAEAAVAGNMLHGLHQLFATNFFPVNLARRTGLNIVNRLSPLKRFFAQRAGS